MKKQRQKPITATPREDGKATKALIIECAGKLIAEHGYAKTTSKSICEKANTNIAAVNYHFGGRDGLYISVLEEVHNHLINVDKLAQLWSSDLSPRDKLEAFLDIYISALEENSWHVKVWAREILNPSPFINQIVTKEALPKFRIVTKIFSEYTGISPEDPKLYSCILSVMSPFILLFLATNNNTLLKVLPVKYSRKELLAHLKQFALELKAEK